MLEARATWQWNNFLEAQAAPGQVVVHINLDETCVRLCPNVQPGAVAVGWHRIKKEAMDREQKANLKARRSALTFVCCGLEPAAQQGDRVRRAARQPHRIAQASPRPFCSWQPCRFNPFEIRHSASSFLCADSFESCIEIRFLQRVDAILIGRLLVGVRSGGRRLRSESLVHTCRLEVCRRMLSRRDSLRMENVGFQRPFGNQFLFVKYSA